jgi:hypothetical protein
MRVFFFLFTIANGCSWLSADARISRPSTAIVPTHNPASDPLSRNHNLFVYLYLLVGDFINNTTPFDHLAARGGLDIRFERRKKTTKNHHIAGKVVRFSEARI